MSKVIKALFILLTGGLANIFFLLLMGGIDQYFSFVLPFYTGCAEEFLQITTPQTLIICAPFPHFSSPNLLYLFWGILWVILMIILTKLFNLQGLVKLFFAIVFAYPITIFSFRFFPVVIYSLPVLLLFLSLVVVFMVIFIKLDYRRIKKKK